MRFRCLLVIGAVVAVAGVPLAGQATRAALPRTASGKPDLSGLWRGFSGVPLERPTRLQGREFWTDEELAERRKTEELYQERTRAGNNYEFAFRAQANLNEIFHYDEVLAPQSKRTSQIIDPPNGRLPMLTPEAVRQWEAREAQTHGRGEADHWTDRGLSERCISMMEWGRVVYWGLGDPPVSRPIKGLGSVEDASVGLEGAGITERDDTQGATGDPDRPLQRIIQNDRFLGVTRGSGNGGEGTLRIVSLDGRPNFGPTVRQYLGKGSGRWEGDTLVIENANFYDAEPMIATYGIRRYPGTGESLRVTERYTLIDADHLEYRYTVTDPAVYSRPYTVLQEFIRDDKFVVAPGLCHENNKDTGPQLAAARFDEANALDFGAEYSGVRLQRLAEVKAEVAAANKNR